MDFVRKRFSFRLRKNKESKKQYVEIPRVTAKRSAGGGESVAGGLSQPCSSEQRSFAIPEGLPMDPLAPNALAVSSDFMDHIGTGLTLLRDHTKKVQKYVWKNKGFDVLKKSWKSVVNVVLVEAKDLPDAPDAESSCLYCKFKLGTETYKSKRVTKSKSSWRERFNLHLYEITNLEVTVWQKGKLKNFMGRCNVDLSKLEKEKTHDIWQELECGYGKIHLLITLSGIARRMSVDNILTTSAYHRPVGDCPEEDEFTWYRLDNGWNKVGELSVRVHGARALSALGLSRAARAYCVLELDNSRIQTHTVNSASDHYWNKTYKFPVNDITSILDITVFDESIISSKVTEMLGKISIPLLRIQNDEKKWYALKNRSRKSNAKGNCPRILLEMSVVWNPIKASVRVLTPKETKYIEKPPKFNIPLIYNNLKWIKNVFQALIIVNDQLKRSFEWNSRDLSALALLVWLAFWYFFRLWMAPLLLLIPFLYNWPTSSSKSAKQNSELVTVYISDEDTEAEEESNKDGLSVKGKVFELQELTLIITDGVEFLVSTVERLRNLTNFTVPYLSYLAMLVLVVASVVLFVIPFNYLFMALGIYKFMRKCLNPARLPNNDILDFISRIPDNKMLKKWRELKVPEPNLSRTSSTRSG